MYELIVNVNWISRISSNKYLSTYLLYSGAGRANNYLFIKISKKRKTENPWRKFEAFILIYIRS